MKSYEEHPIKIFSEHKIPFSLCMDNWLLSGDLKHQPDPNQEILVASKLIGWKNLKYCMKKALFLDRFT